MKHRLPLINLISYIALVIVNFLAIQLPFFGRRPGDVADLYPNLLTPADFSFRIWSVIYVLLGRYIFHQSASLFRKNKPIPEEVSAIGLLFLWTSILNSAWLLAWQSLHIAWAFALIFLLWILLILINYRLTMLGHAKWTYRVPFSTYLAWMSIAALANLNVLLIDIGFNFFGLTDEYWTAILVVIGILGTLLVLYLNGDIWFTLVLIWAFFGIYIKNKNISGGDNWVVTMSLFAMFFLFIVGSWIGWRKWTARNLS